MPKLKEYSIDLTAQELLRPLSTHDLTEIDDVCSMDVLELPEVANTEPQRSMAPAPDESLEIELSAQEIDALLSALPQA